MSWQSSQSIQFLQSSFILKFSITLFTLSLNLACQDPVEQKCNQVCDIFVSCTEKTLKQTFSPEIKKQGRLSCLDGCTTHNSDILQCYDQVGDSCQGFATCLQQMDSLE